MPPPHPTLGRLLPTPGIDRARRLLRGALQAVSPHFCVARGVQLVGETQEDPAGPAGPAVLARHLARRLGATLAGAGADTSSSRGGGGGGGFGPDPLAGTSPWAWAASGEPLAWLAAQAAVYGAAVLLVEMGVLPRLWRRAQRAWRGIGRGSYQPLPVQDGASEAAASAAAAAEDGEAEGEDEDVAAERLAVQSGRLASASIAVLLRGVSKTYWQRSSSSGHARGEAEHGGASHGHIESSSGAVRAVRDLWLAIGRPHQQQPPQQDAAASAASSGASGSGGGRRVGECFGLLGANGAGKTTTWRIVTGGREGSGVPAGSTLRRAEGLAWPGVHSSSAHPLLSPASAMLQPCRCSCPHAVHGGAQERSHLTLETQQCAACRCQTTPPPRAPSWATARRPARCLRR